jgi:lipid-A-disaccharide synthase
MHAEGMEILKDVTDMAVVGIIEVLKNYRFFKRTLNDLLAEVEKRKPAVVIGVDYPGFNLRFLERAKRVASNIPGYSPKLIQFVSPQLWAWNEKRKWKMAQYVDAVLCIFPFEPEIYKGTGLIAKFVGHPLPNKISFSPLENRDPNLIALFPGSREKEIQAHAPTLSVFETQFKKSFPEVRFAYASSSEKTTALIRSFVPEAVIEIPTQLEQRAAVGIVCSGTATLEAALAGLPMCVIYRVAWTTYWMGRALIRTPHLAMPNLLVGRELVREFIQGDLTAENLCQEVERLRKNSDAQKAIFEGYQEIRQKLGTGNAGDRAAEEILSLIHQSA